MISELMGEPIDACRLNSLIPRISRDMEDIAFIGQLVAEAATSHTLILGDARNLSLLVDKSVHLVVTSPPYWTLKDYGRSSGQLGCIKDYTEFLDNLDRVWSECYRVLVPGGRLVVVAGDICQSRRVNGRHFVIPFHADIQLRCRELGYDNLNPIIWHKIANASFEGKGNGNGLLGKSYEPNGVIKNDVEYILMQRKPGGYRSPDSRTRLLSTISQDCYKRWFRQIWMDVGGEAGKKHPAPFPVELANRLIRMFSYVGDTVLDPFCGTGTTSIAAMRSGRNSIGVEVSRKYFSDMARRVEGERLLHQSATVSRALRD